MTTRVVQLATGHTLPPPLLGGVRSIYVVTGAVHGQGMILGEGDFAEEARPVQEWRARRPSTVLELSSSRPDAYGLRVFAASHAIWTLHGTGRRARILVNEFSAGREVMLIRVEAGATLEGHDADAVQELYVLEGSCVIENQALMVGDYHRAPAGARPGPATTSEGCLLFSVTRDLRVLPAA
jgi:quercetin dioxygenase-like cupin family protein